MRTFNISQTYVDKDDPWLGILAAAAFVIPSKTNRQKIYSPGQLIFGRDIIILIEHTVDLELTRQKNQTQIDKYNIRENIHRVDYKYKVRDNVMLTKHTAYKDETPYTGTFVITECFTIGTVELQYGATKNRYNICHIKPYKLDTKVEDINIENTDVDINI